jgi:hypothetical protein
LQVAAPRLQMHRRANPLKGRENFGCIATSAGLVCNLLAGVAIGRQWAGVFAHGLAGAA